MKVLIAWMAILAPAIAGAEDLGKKAQGSPQPDCRLPTASFRWTGPNAAFLETNAKFNVTDGGGATPDRAMTGGKDEKPVTTVTTVTTITTVTTAAPEKPATIATTATIARPAKLTVSIDKLDGGTWSVDIPEVTTQRSCFTAGDGNCEQAFAVDFHRGNDDKVAPLLDRGGRVTVEFQGLDVSHHCPNGARLDGVVAMEQHHLAIDQGVSFDLDRDGKLSPHYELALNANSRWRSWFSGDIDLRLVKLSAVDSGASSTSPNFTPKGGQAIDAAVRALVHLDRARAPDAFVSLADVPNPWLAVVAGAGVRSFIAPEGTATSDGATKPELRGRLFAGLRLQVLGYNAGKPAESFGDTRGYFEAGYARDQFWRGLDMARLYLEGQIEIPGVVNKNVRLLARIAVDRPWGSGSGPSEVRISALASIKPAVLSAFFGVPEGK